MNDNEYIEYLVDLSRSINENGKRDFSMSFHEIENLIRFVEKRQLEEIENRKGFVRKDQRDEIVRKDQRDGTIELLKEIKKLISLIFCAVFTIATFFILMSFVTLWVNELL